MKTWSIYKKTRYGLALLLLMLVALAGIGLFSLSLFRAVVRDVAWRTEVLPICAEMSASVGEMRTIVGELRGIRRLAKFNFVQWDYNLHGKFVRRLDEFKAAYERYGRALDERRDRLASDTTFHREYDTFLEIKPKIIPIQSMADKPGWWSDDTSVAEMEECLGELRALVELLPVYLHEGMATYSDDIRRHYRWLFAVVIGTTVLSGVLLGLLLWCSYKWIYAPLRLLIEGSRKIAAGKFQHRISLNTRDEMAELAEAMNRMTARFEEIRNDLDRQVRVRTQEVVRSEQLASVGFLAAGVAHEINNPLASIAMSAESLQRRLKPILARCQDGFGNINTMEKQDQVAKTEESKKIGDFPEEFDAELLLRFLTMIQDEAFRCKGITEKLLDLARAGNKTRETTDLAALVGDLVDMLSQHGAYKSKHLIVETPYPVYAPINAQEIKQVVLNLLINGLDFVPEGGTVRVALLQDGNRAVLEVIDNGAGMSDQVLTHVFEPFFTKRKCGQGTGLGLSISHRIVYDHGGLLTAFSDGPGFGSTFRMELPIQPGVADEDSVYLLHGQSLTQVGSSSTTLTALSSDVANPAKSA